MGTLKQKPTDDYANEVLWLAIALQAMFLAGTYWKIPLFTSTPMFLAQLFAPAAIIILASTRERAIKFSILSSMVIPAGITLILLILAVVSFFVRPGSGNLLKLLGMNIKMSLMVWALVLAAAVPSLLIGACIRFAWSKYKQ